ncbi:MAG: hypothetical protein HPY30_06035 [Gammaproteobacteria bacterium (ex Lamellibrachia satsuma)]|nr:MAG: hypothetical protein HPY30_06035 [Gammaproteobacteria bacterium (ex Lamellibrachia satsuma)]
MIGPTATATSLNPTLTPTIRRQLGENETSAEGRQQASDFPTRSSRSDEKTASTNEPKPTQTTDELGTTELRLVQELKSRDQAVRAHELAHLSAAGQYARGGAQFDYKVGPDGNRYAVGGEVSIDSSRESDPKRTLEKAETIRQAALAPADPSSQDRRVAMQATAMAAQARVEIAREQSQGEGEAGNQQPSSTARGIDRLITVQSADQPDPVLIDMSV